MKGYPLVKDGGRYAELATALLSKCLEVNHQSLEGRFKEMPVEVQGKCPVKCSA